MTAYGIKHIMAFLAYDGQHGDAVAECRAILGDAGHEAAAAAVLAELADLVRSGETNFVKRLEALPVPVGAGPPYLSRFFAVQVATVAAAILCRPLRAVADASAREVVLLHLATVPADTRPATSPAFVAEAQRRFLEWRRRTGTPTGTPEADEK